MKVPKPVDRCTLKDDEGLLRGKISGVVEVATPREPAALGGNGETVSKSNLLRKNFLPVQTVRCVQLDRRRGEKIVSQRSIEGKGAFLGIRTRRTCFVLASRRAEATHDERAGAGV